MYSSDSNMWRRRWWSGLRACRPHEKVPLLLLHPQLLTNLSVLYLFHFCFVYVFQLFCIFVVLHEKVAFLLLHPLLTNLTRLYLYCICFVLYLCNICFVFVLYSYCICVVFVLYCMRKWRTSSLTFLPTLQFLPGSMTREIWFHF